MGEELSTTAGGLRKRLDEAEVLMAVVLQLRKDLGEEGIPVPSVSVEAFEAVRGAVLAILELWGHSGSPALSRAINRVDLTEGMVDSALGSGGPKELAGVMVLRCLQKVLLRERFAGRA
jgi:hypothetical protein